MTERIVAAFVPLVDCAVLVAAREQGFAEAAGIELVLVKEPSWASLRDHLCLGYVDCAHALAPLPVALTLGVGHLKVECVAPFVLGRGGNAITVSNRLFAEMQSTTDEPLEQPAAAGRALATVVRRRQAPLTLGMVFPFSNHNFDLRYWLAAAGVHPDRDVRLVAIPPPLMVDSLEAGLVDGFCVGEPWNGLAAAQGLGVVVATQSQLFPHSVEKVLALRRAFAEREPRLCKLLQALDEAAAWADDPAHHSALSALLARPEYLALPQEIIGTALGGLLRIGVAPEKRDANFLYFHRHGANVPSEADGLWTYAQMVRWGQLAPSREAEAAAARVFRADLYRSGIAHPAAPPSPQPAFDRIAFSPAGVQSYLGQFDLSTPYSNARSL